MAAPFDFATLTVKVLLLLTIISEDLSRVATAYVAHGQSHHLNGHNHDAHPHRHARLDIRHVSHTELDKTMDVFVSEGVVSFTQILFDLPRYQVLVGARDNIFRISLEGLQKMEEAYWPAPENAMNLCKQKGQTDADCHNYIMVLLQHENSIFTCGTGAFSPQCTWRQINNISAVTELTSGLGKCPYSPRQNVTALMTSEKNYYMASVVDFSARDPSIIRSVGPAPVLRTPKSNSKWLSEPNFVGSFEIDDFIYFFFRETAVEFINCGKTIYSRVARVCKNDKGGLYMLKENWTTFLKARLNCSLPGEYPFYYNEIQSVYFLEQEQLLYATFTTPPNSIHGTAVCAYNMKAINKAFSGAFKVQSKMNAAWDSQSASHQHFQCGSSSDHRQQEASDKYQLMDEAVQPISVSPVLNEEGQRFSHIVADVVETKVHQAVHVLFVATTDGVIKKLSILPRTQETCLVEILHVFPKNHSQAIKQMKILKSPSLKSQHSLFLGTETSVMKIPLARCTRFSSRQSCLSAMDPYCGWNNEEEQCMPPPNGDPIHSSWEQSLLQCPILTDSVDGGWSEWSGWHECQLLGGEMSSNERCLCRNRQCDNPSPAHGGQTCGSHSQEVANCTRNGQWTEWSAWSACSQTCGMAVRTRRRSCGNPAPAFGGQHCDGTDKSEIYCTSNPPCPSMALQPIDGGWSNWGQWDDCTVPCGGGFQIRRRRCDNPVSQNGGRECVGGSEEYQQCNRKQCEEERRSHWSTWLIANITSDGYHQQRHRMICRANVPYSSMIKVSHIKTEDRFCTKDLKNCVDEAFIGNDGDWSEWNTWSTCSVKCGGGTQTRLRACDNPKPNGRGKGCPGDDKEDRSCNAQQCTEEPEVEGSPPWSPWSVCDENNYQHRHKVCPKGMPTNCPEAKEDSRPCDAAVLAGIAGGVAGGGEGLSVGSMVAGCIICFMAGSILTAVGSFYYIKKRPRRHASLNNSNRAAKQNLYQPPVIKNATLTRNHSKTNYDTLNSKRSNKTTSLNSSDISDQEKYG